MGLIIFVILLAGALAGAIASALVFDLALRFGLFGKRARETRPHICPLRFAILPIGVVAAMGAITIYNIHRIDEMPLLACSVALGALLVVGIKFVLTFCAARGCRRRRTPRDLDNNSDTIEPTDAGRVALVPHA